MPSVSFKNKPKVSKKKSTFREWAHALFFAVCSATAIHWLILEPSYIPTSSMEATLLVGDFIIVSKLHYGTRTPKTPLQLPLMYQTIKGTDIPAYLDWIKLPIYRLPGISKVKRGDKIVFNCTHELDKPIDMRTYCIKRCVGLPGETIQIKDGRVYIDGKLEDDIPTLQYRFYIQTHKSLDRHFFLQHGIKEYIEIERGYLVNITQEKAAMLRGLSYISDVKLILSPKNYFNPAIYPHNTEWPWNEDYWGPMLIPAKGMEIKINAENLGKYKNIITLYEDNPSAYIEDNELWINGQVSTSYTFKKNYYFAMGDNRHNSADARFTGFIPEDHLIGKAIMTVFSTDAAHIGWNKFRKNRFLKLLKDI